MSDVEKSPPHALLTTHLPARPVVQRSEHLPRWIVHEPVRVVLAVRCRVVPLPLDRVVHALLPVVAQLVQLHVVLDEGVGEHTEHQQHERLGRAVQHGAHAPDHHHQSVAARGKTELERIRTNTQVEMKTKGKCFVVKNEKLEGVLPAERSRPLSLVDPLFPDLCLGKKANQFFFFLKWLTIRCGKLSKASVFYSLLIVLWSCHGPAWKKTEAFVTC